MKTVVATLSLLLAAASVYGDPVNCNLAAYRGAPGLAAATTAEAVVITWDSERGEQVRLGLGIQNGAPVVREIAVRPKTGTWTTLGTNLVPEYEIVSGFRRITNQQLSPLRGLNVPLTQAVVEKYKWDAFHDAPLDMSVPTARGGGADFLHSRDLPIS